MTSRDWLDEQMDQADHWHEAEELRRDEIEWRLRGDDEPDPVLEQAGRLGPTPRELSGTGRSQAHFDDEDNLIIGPDDQTITVRELSDRENS